MSQNSTVNNFLISLMNAPEREPYLTGKSVDIKEVIENRRSRTGSLEGFHLNDIFQAAVDIKNGYASNSSEMRNVINGLGNLSTRVSHFDEDDDPFFV